jgi:regulator of RNase E activity RraA
MRERGCVGSLVDGGVRDVRWLRQHNFPVFARYRTPVQSIGRWKVTGWQTPVKLRGATTKYVSISPGDFILGDEDGVIAIPAAVLDQVLTRSEELTRKEVAIRKEIAKGLSLADALKTFGHV